MAVVGELVVLIAGNNAPLSAALAASRAEMRGFSGEVSAQGSVAGAALRGVGIAGAAVAAGVGIIGYEAVRAGASFQSAMELIHTQAGASQGEVNRLTTAVLALAPTVGIGPEQLAAGLFHVESAGMRGARAMDLLTTAAEGAKVGHADLESVTNALIASVTSGIGGVHSMSEAMGVLNAIVGQGNMRMDDLTAAFTTGILSSARTFGVSIQSVGAALADLTRQGQPAEQSATRLGMTMSLLGAPSAKAAAEFHSIGIGTLDLATAMRGPEGIVGALQLLQDHLEASGLNATQQAQLISNAFGGGRSSKAIMALLGDLTHVGEIQQQITKHTGDFGEAWAATEETAADKASDLGASFATITTAIGTGLLPAVGAILDRINPVVVGIAQWAALNPGLASNILLVTGAVAALAASTLLLGPLIAALTGPIGLIAVAIVGLAVAWMNNWMGIRDIVSSVIGSISPVIGGIVDFVQELINVVSNFGDGFDDAMGEAAVGGDKTFTTIGTIFQTLARIIPLVIPVVQRVMTTVGQAISWVTTNVIPQFGRAVTAIASWVVANWPRISSIAGQVFGAVGKVLTVAGEVIANVVTTVWPILVRVAEVLFPMIGTAASVLLTVIDTAFKLIGGIMHGLAIVAHSVSHSIGTTWNALTAVFNTVSTGIGAAVNVAAGFIRGLLGVVHTVAKAIGDFFGWITGNTNTAGRQLNQLTPAPAGLANIAHGGMGVGAPYLTQPGGAIRSGAHGLLQFQHGGMVPGIGPQLAIVHGGEEVVPGGGRTQPTVINKTIQLVVDGRVLAEVLDREMFSSANVFSSGFAANNPIAAS